MLGGEGADKDKEDKPDTQTAEDANESESDSDDDDDDFDPEAGESSGEEGGTACSGAFPFACLVYYVVLPLIALARMCSTSLQHDGYACASCFSGTQLL